jgi:hypothetical protein
MKQPQATDPRLRHMNVLKSAWVLHRLHNSRSLRQIGSSADLAAPVVNQLRPSSSTSNTSVEFGGMTGG